MSQASPTDVAAAALLSQDRQRVLLQRRHAEAHQGGLWEFPGGKIEPGESAEFALCRELREELDIEVSPVDTEFLLEHHHDYGDKRVVLRVYIVKQWQGEPNSTAQLPLEWVEMCELHRWSVPAANNVIVVALQRLARDCVRSS